MNHDVLTGSHDPLLVVVSIVVAVATSYCALDLAGRMRAASGWTTRAWLATAATAMGGGIWAMHFVAMLALGLPLPVAYDPWLTGLSLATPIVVTGLGFVVVRRRAGHAADIALGGLLMGTGVAAMHYIGMAAMRTPAQMHHDALLVTLSIIIAIAASTVALWMSLRDTGLLIRVGAATAMGLAIAGMHYTAMAAASWHQLGDDALWNSEASQLTRPNQIGLALGVTTAIFLVLLLSFIAAVVDRRLAAVSRKEAELALRESEVRAATLAAEQAAILEQLAEGVIVTDPDGRITFVNEAAAQIHGGAQLGVVPDGYSRAYQLYTEDGELYPPDELPLSRAVRQGVSITEARWRIRRPDGSEVLAVGSARPFRGGDGKVLGAVLVVRDDTARTAAETALRENEERFRTFAEHAPHVIYIVDVLARRLEYLSPAFERVWGESRSTIMNDLSRWREFLHPDDRGRTLDLQKQFYEGAEPIEFEYRIIRPADGRTRHIRETAVPILDVHGRIVRTIGIAHDITIHRQAEAAMRAGDERMALATAAAKLGVWDVDIRAGTGIHNREFRAIYGLPQDERPIAHSEWLQMIHPEDRERVHKVALAAQAGEADYAVEFRIIRADTAELRWIASRGSIVSSGPDGRPARLVGVSYDVTERRQEQERQLMLAREVDHRAKNVLAVVQSIVRLTKADDPRTFAQAVEGRVAALARAHTLLSRDRWTGASLTEVVREELLAYGGGGRIALEGQELWLKPDTVQSLSMVLHELATNAAKYGALSVPHGRLIVSWRVGHQAAGSQLHLEWVERGGPNVPAPPARRGFGSTVITATMRSHLDGEAHMIWEEQGLRCEITAPAARLLAMVPPDDPAPVQDGHAAYAVSDLDTELLHGRRVMVVEDEPLLALEIGATLQQLGCELVGPASTLAEALRLAAVEAADLDAVVMDVNLRGQASFPIADLLAGQSVVVIYVSGYGTLPEPSSNTMEAPLLLRKPLRDGELAAALRHALGRRERDRIIDRRGT